LDDTTWVRTNGTNNNKEDYMNFYSMQQADNMALNAVKGNHVLNGIVHQPEFYNPTCKATIPEVFQVVKNGEIVDECYSLEQAQYSARNHNIDVGF
jgi:hypothetical protein